MIEGYLKEDELYELIMKKPTLPKQAALNFIKSYGNGRVIAAFEEDRRKQGGISFAGLDEKEMEARFKSINQSMNRLLHSLADALKTAKGDSRRGKVLS
jgi:hypothetical protein